MNKIIVEVGSTVTKVNKYDGSQLEKIKDITILFKKHFKEDGQLRESDIQELINNVKELKSVSEDIFVCGTSIFRTLNDSHQQEFLKRFKSDTGYDFDIITEEQESSLTVCGATRFVASKVCVFIGGGGSTEIAIYDEEIMEAINSPIGVIDIMNEFPDLALNYATTDIETVKEYIKKHLNLPKTKADILILSGGGHEKFARLSGLKYEDNTLYNDEMAPIMMDIKTRINETERYFKDVSLDEIRSRVDDPEWWYATRAMCAFVLVVADAIQAKYVIPTDINMAYGLLKKFQVNEENSK